MAKTYLDTAGRPYTPPETWLQWPAVPDADSYSVYKGMIPGNTITIAWRPKWWQRALIWLRLRKRPPEPKQWVFGWDVASGDFGQSAAIIDEAYARLSERTS